jgi:hypothetical protein
METTMGKEISCPQELLKCPWNLSEICESLAGGEALSQISGKYGKTKQALWKWLNSNEERRADYIAALEGRGFLHLEQIERLAADVEAGRIDARAGDVAIRARTWIAGRLNPKLLSEKWRGSLEVQQTDVRQLHLEAMKKLCEKRKDELATPETAMVDATHELKAS